MSQAHLAGLVGVHEKTVQKWESGSQLPDRHLEALEEVLGISLTNKQPVAEQPLALSQMTYQQLVNLQMRITGELARRGEPGRAGSGGPLSVTDVVENGWSATRRGDLEGDKQAPSEDSV